MIKRFSKAVLTAVAMLVATSVSAQVQMSGTLTNTPVVTTSSPQVQSAVITFTCTGAPTCTGTYVETFHFVGCPSAITYSGAMTFVFNPATAPGPYTAPLTFKNGTFNFSFAPTCSVSPVADDVLGASGTWNGTTGTLNHGQVANTGNPAQDYIYTGTFTVSGLNTPLSTPPPVIGVNATSNITSTTANVTATIRPRTQDVGTTASIFVFAQAPSNLVIGAAQFDRAPASAPIPAATEDAIVCVLAQVNSNGQLVAVSASTMQAYLTGVLTAQSQSLSLLNNVPTPNVAGASLFVGYGSSAAAMLSSGIFQTAVSVPGTVQCTARTDAAPAANAPGEISGLWWNSNESGWGLHLTQRGTNKFAAWYTYDSAGNPKWYVATCAGASGTTGTCTGTLYEVTGPNFFGGAFNASLVNAVNAGTLTVTFQSATSASMTYAAVAGQTRTVSLTRQPLGTGTTPPAVDYTDIWWGGASESGWGMAMAQQFGVTFLAWYVYDASGKPTWLVATCAMSGSSCSGTLYRTTGPPFGPTFNANLVQATAAGNILVSFIDANNAVISYTVNGVTATKVVTRQVF